MELQQLRYVVAVARTGNFSRAAAQCHVSQPSLSQQIQKLENELGERLFDRLKREARPTSHGEVFLDRALTILSEVELVIKEAGGAKDLLHGTMTIGVLPTLAPYLLPRAIAAFMARYPGVQIVVHEDTTDRLVQLALACEIDLALASRPIRDKRMEVVDLFTEELQLAAPPGHPLMKKRKLTARDLDGEPLIVMKEGHCLGEQVLAFCDRQNLRPRISFRSAQLETIQSLVRAGLGISLIPKMAILGDFRPSLHYRSLPEPRPNRKVVAVWPRHRPPGRAAAQFLKLISQPKSVERARRQGAKRPRASLAIAAAS